MDVQPSPGASRLADRSGITPDYMSGFGNQFETGALRPG